MDYLQEVKRRQQAALARLLTGERGSETVEIDESSCRGGIRSGIERRQTAYIRPVPNTPVPDAKTGQAQPAEEPSAQKRSSLPEISMGTGPKNDGTEFFGQAKLFRQIRRADDLWRSGTVYAGNLPELLTAAWEEPAADAETVSRAIERDARRYDGGFTMF